LLCPARSQPPTKARRPQVPQLTHLNFTSLNPSTPLQILNMTTRKRKQDDEELQALPSDEEESEEE
jgi:hypothetical protein